MLLTQLLLEELGVKNILLLDIDDTILKAKNIFIHKKTDDGNSIALTPEEYAKEKVDADNKHMYDYSEFRDPKKVGRSITTGTPLVNNLKVMDKYIQNGYQIGILTARSEEDVIFKAIQKFLQFRDYKGNLKKVGPKLQRSLVFAINDERKKYPGKTDSERKSLVIYSLAKNYDSLIFMDDDQKNIDAVKELVKKLKQNGEEKTAKKISAIKV